MANFNGFPVGYTPYYPQMQQPSNDRIWVQGEAGAKSYLVAPNNTVTMWDSEQPTIYIKSADASGLPSMKILDYTIRENANIPRTAPLNDTGKEYATKEDLEALKGEILAEFNTFKSEVSV